MIRGLLTLALGFVLINLPGQVLLAQGIPTPTLLVNTRCSVGHGYSINDVLEVARSDSFDGPNAPRWIGYRVPVAGNGEMEPDQVIRAVRWESLAHWDAHYETFVRDRDSNASVLLRQMLDCDEGNRSFMRDWAIDDQGTPYEGGTIDSTLSTYRVCELKPGNTVEDLYNVLASQNAEARADGDRNHRGFSMRWLGPREGVEMNTGIGIRIIGENASALASYLDSTPVTGAGGTPEGAPVTNCGDRMMFRSHTVHDNINQ